MGAKLDSLIRFQQWELDNKRRALAVLEEERDIILGQLNGLLAEYKAEAENASHEAATLTMGAYAVGVTLRRDVLEEQLAAKDQEIDAARDILTEAFQELKTYEIAHDNRIKAEEKEAIRQENNQLDEQGLQSYRRGREG